MEQNKESINQVTNLPISAPRFKGVLDFLLIIKDRWLWGLLVAIPASILFAYKQFNVDKAFSVTTNFRFEQKLNTLNLTPVVRQDFSKYVLAQHVSKLQSLEFRQRIETALTEEEREILLRPYNRLHAERGLPLPSIPSLLSYSVIMTPMDQSTLPMITITAYSKHEGQGSSIIANRILSEYPKHIRETTVKSDNTVLTKLRDQLSDMSKEEKLLEQQLEEFRRKNNIVSFETEREFFVKSMDSIKNNITSSKIDKLHIQTVLLQIFRAKQEGKNLVFIEEVANFRNVNSYRDRIVELQRGLKKLEERYLDRHPTILTTKAEIAEAEVLLTAEVESAIKVLEQRIVTINQREKEYQKELAVVHAKVQQLDLLEIDYRVLSREVEAKTSLRDAMLKRITDIETLNEIDDDPPLKPGSQTGTPLAPYAPNKQDIISKALGVFFMTFLFLPIGLEFLDNRVKSPWDIEVFIGRDMLAGIPRISLVTESNRPLIVAQDLDENLVESFRGLYSRIQMNSDGIFPKSILVTSAIPSEGKSLLAANLAHSFANHGKKTLLMDFDLRRPGLHKFCDVSNDRGLLTYIQELQANPSANINFDFIPEVYPNLRLLPSGGKTRTATELLDKVAFTNLFIKLKREFDVLLLDSSPVGLFPDSNALATKVDELIFVTRYAKVGRRTAKSMLEKLEETGTKILGVVLNDLPEKKSNSYYYNYGYYGYGYGYYRYKYYSKYYGDGAEDRDGKA